MLGQEVPITWQESSDDSIFEHLQESASKVNASRKYTTDLAGTSLLDYDHDLE